MWVVVKPAIIQRVGWVRNPVMSKIADETGLNAHFGG